MDNVSEANNALAEYIDTLLMDAEGGNTSAPPVSAKKEVEPPPVIEEVQAPPPVLERAPSQGLSMLFFKVAGIPLAVAMEDVAGVIDDGGVDLEGESIDETARQGSLVYQGREVAVLDVKDLILPPGHPARNAGHAEHIIVLAGHDVGLLCDQVEEPLVTEEGEVEWRQQRQSRPWLAGMIKTNNHALLDVDALLRDH